MTKPRVLIHPQSHPRRPQAIRDIRQTKEYKAASRRWISTIVALPILLYTSYELFERTYGGKSQKKLGPGSSSSDQSGGK